MSAINSLEVEVDPGTLNQNLPHRLDLIAVGPDAVAMNSSDGCQIGQNLHEETANVEQGVDPLSRRRKRGCCYRCFLVLCTIVLLLFMAAVPVLFVLYLNGSLYMYNSKSMAELQPKLIQKVYDIIKYGVNASVTNDTRSVCYSESCLQASKELLESMDFNVDPCEDFYSFVCGGWMKKHPSSITEVPSDHFDRINAKVARITESIMEGTRTAKDPKALTMARELFRECNDLDTLQNKGLQPLLSILSSYGGWPILMGKDWNGKEFDWIQTAADLQRISSPAVLAIDLRQFPARPNTTSVFIVHGSFSIPREYLSSTLEKHWSIFYAYKQLIRKVTKLLAKEAGRKLDPKRLERDITDMLELEMELARSSKEEETRSSHAQTFYDLPKLQVETDMYTNDYSVLRIEWKKFLDSVFADSGVKIRYDERIVIQDLKLIHNLVTILNRTTKDTIANYLLWRLLSKVMSGTTEEMRELVNKFNYKVYGILSKPKRPTTCAFLITDMFQVALGYEFLRRKGDQSDVIGEMEELVETIKTGTESLLVRQKFIPTLLKSGITNKLNQIRHCVGYPKFFLQLPAIAKFYKDLDYSNLTYIEKCIHIERWRYDKTLRTLREKFDFRCWHGNFLSFIGEAYGYFDTARNLIHFSLGLMQPPFYRKNTPHYLNYGAIGSIVGHEITHGLNLEGWMKLKLADELEEFLQCLVLHYSSYDVPEAGNMSKLDGYRTRFENFADQFGMAEAYHSYQYKIHDEELAEKKLPGLEMFTPVQTFFISFTHMWCLSGSKESMYDEVHSSSHAPAKYRVLGTLRNSKAFSDHWHCPKNSYMRPYRTPPHSCSLF